MRLRRTYIAVVAVLCLILCSCGVSKEDKSPLYNDCVIILPENPYLYETLAAENIQDFISKKITVQIMSENEDYTKDSNTLYVYLGQTKETQNLSSYCNMTSRSTFIKGEYNRIYVCGTIPDLTYLAAEQLIFEGFDGEVKNIQYAVVDEMDIYREYTSREEYIVDISGFPSCWQYRWEPPSWMLSFDEKEKSYTEDGRPMSYAHRGGVQFYPENSIESIISAIQMGCDILEIDIQVTRDGIPVLIHGNLDVSTDWAEKKGLNGLPKSDKVIAWTYQQLKQLRLKFNYGDYASAEGETTSYVIPTFEEVMNVCRNRCYVNIDKIDGTKASNWELLYGILKKTDSTRNFLLGHSMKTEDKDCIIDYQKQMQLDGVIVSPSLYPRKNAGDLDVDRYIISEDELHVFFKKYTKQGINVLTDHPYEFVKYLSERIKL